MGLMSFGLPGLGLSLIISVLLCVHVVRTHREMYWLWIILLFQPIGGLVYLIAIVLPEMFRGPTARKLGRSAQETLDPSRAYRQARQDYDLAPTVHNQMKLAATRKPRTSTPRPCRACTRTTRLCCWAAPGPCWSSAGRQKPCR